MATPITAPLSFERTCAGCRERRGRPGPQPCERCGEITQTVLCWIEDADRRTCASCKRRPAEGIEPLCVQCLRREARKRSQELREARQREQGKLW